MTHPPQKLECTTDFSLKKWGTLREQTASKKSTVPRASWPEENTEVLQDERHTKKILRISQYNFFWTNKRSFLNWVLTQE